jgi:hypothetical protein
LADSFPTAEGWKSVAKKIACVAGGPGVRVTAPERGGEAAPKSGQWGIVARGELAKALTGRPRLDK